MNKNTLWLIPLVSLGPAMLVEAAQADRDTAPLATEIRTTSDAGHDPATDIASITADRGIVTRPGHPCAVDRTDQYFRNPARYFRRRRVTQIRIYQQV